MPDVTLTIKVKDGEVKDAEASLKRLEKSANDLGKSNTNKGVFGDKSAGLSDEERNKRIAKFLGKDLPKAAQDATAAVAEVGTASTGTASGMAGLASAGGVATLTIAGFAAAAVIAVAVIISVAEEILHLAKTFADYALDIGRAAEETGLATETVSALKYEAEATGRSFDVIAGPIGNFRKLIGEAAAGSEDAKKKLTSLGIDGPKAIYDIDAAFKIAVANIVKAPAGIDQVRLAFNAFGDDGYKLIPFLKEFNGNVDAAVQRARDLGLAISGPDVAAAKEFNRAYEDVKKVVLGLTYTFGREFLPGVTKALSEFGNWILSNKETIKDWATSMGNWVSWLVDHWTTFKGIVEGVANSIAYITRIPLPETTRSQTAGPAPLPNYDPSLNTKSPEPDLAALEALRAKGEELQKQREQAAKAELSAQIQLYEMSATQIGSAYDKAFNEITERFKTTLNISQYQADWQTLKQWYGEQINELAPKWTELVEKQTLALKKGAMEQEVIKRTLEERQQALGDKTTEHEKAATKAISDVKRKADAESLGELQARIRREIELYDERDQTELQRRQLALATGQTTEQQYLDFVKKNEVDALYFRKQKLKELLDATSGNSKKRADIEGQISVIDEQITRKKAENEERLTTVYAAQRDLRREINRLAREEADPSAVAARRTVAALNEQLSLTQQIHDLRDAIANQGLNDSLIIEAAHLQDILDYRNRELQAVLTINRAQLELDHSMEISQTQIKARVLDHLAQQRNLNQAIADGINQTYDDIASKLDDQIDKMFAWAGAFKSLFTEPLKAISRNSLTKLTRGLLDAVFPGLGTDLTKTNNPIARPIVDEIEKTNALLSQLVRSTGQIPTAGSGVGGLLGGLLGIGSGGSGGGLGTIFGGSAGGGIYNLGSGGGGGLVLDTGNLPGAPGSPSNPSGGLLGRLGNIFSSRPGGIFAPPTNPITGQPMSQLTGYLSGAGSLAQLAGGLIGGRAGGFLSSIGGGISLGAQIGSIIPGIGTLIGAGIGAAVGFFASLFGGDPKKKRDRDEKIPALTKGFTDAFTELNSILADIRALRIDPDEAVSRATAVRNQIATGFGIQFESKKYRKESQQQIATRLTEADRIINEIKSDAAIARGAADRTKRILPEFAGGTYFADFFRPNGLVPGMFDGRDDIMAMISRGEMVLNPAQQNRVRSLAGGDVFAHAGIPNYPRASTSPRLATGGIGGQGLALAAQPASITIQPRFTVVLQGDVFDERASAYLQGDDGRRVQAKVTKQLKLSGDI